jgi:DHA1 family bicyclomycin/chloramphenicol resistance-like MFS transporter
MDIFKLRQPTVDICFMSLSFIGASQLNSLLKKKYSSEQMIFGH